MREQSIMLVTLLIRRIAGALTETVFVVVKQPGPDADWA